MHDMNKDMELSKYRFSLAEETYKMCVPILEQNSARSKAEATTIATLLDNNVKLWKATLKHNAENEN